MKTIALMTIFVLSAASTPVQAQDVAARERLLSSLDASSLSKSANGRSFEVNGSSFRLASPAGIEDRGDFSRPAGTSSRSKRSTESTSPSADAGRQKIAAAVSADGAPVVVTSRVNVFFADGAQLEAAARATGGKLVNVSRVAGKAIMEYASVNAALDAPQRLLGQAGITAAEPELVQGKEKLK